MAKHKDTMVAFESIVDNFNYADPEHCNKLLPMILKCSDISNEVRPTLVAGRNLAILLLMHRAMGRSTFGRILRPI